ncbi:Aspartate--tRNA ligase [Candidatus Fokinia solitaria]|uniref:Aspartate--tRNA(Asp/Asn) ligase n=1 Tax=Candidatus Fokinia solitaria TaxID=1802984 RepID=A0A2U8BSG4_9RICK|nr:aspartate--tRNA ligase [Candidatus Fokinia solitaria]AWD33277.1 Aspartate--tRNA ligase [Candidatus Fokinia solitaria]
MMKKLLSKYRTHISTELSSSNIGQEITISGWIRTKRDHGRLCFIDLHDAHGIVQCVISDEHENSSLVDLIKGISCESVIMVKGVIVKREENNVNNTLKSGEIEVLIKHCEVLSRAAVLPFDLGASDVSEQLRLKYRFLDLRREWMRERMLLRSNVIRYIRDKMFENNFIEFQTPILTASSPEGARDFLVPSRLHPGKFYALPQAPQMFKQLVMYSGFDRYFQIAPCFRDEDSRADRAPGEFYQLDIELAFVEQDDVLNTIEPIIRDIFAKFGGEEKVAKGLFPRIAYNDAMLMYGTDKPDLRIDIKICDFTKEFKNSDFSIFKNAIQSGNVVRVIPVKCKAQPRSFYDTLSQFAEKELGAKGLAYVTWDNDGTFKGPIAKFINGDVLNKIHSEGIYEKFDACFFVCDVKSNAEKLSGKLRVKIAEMLNMIDESKFAFCWIVDFPMYELSDEIVFSHNPFSMPIGGHEVIDNAKSVEDILNIKGYQYDIVCNGVELSSGAIRNNDLELLYKCFAKAGYSRETVSSNFKPIVTALKYGVPPHGGIAPGIDRMIMLLAGEKHLRDIILFPLNQNGEDTLMGAPTTLTQQQLREMKSMLKELSIMR